MSRLRPVLGRGLASLIPKPEPVPPAPIAAGRADDGVTDRIIAHIDLGSIQPNPFQPRADFDAVALEELRKSIQEKGVIQPITVRRLENGYQLISGERRVRAAREAGLGAIPAYIIHVASSEEMLELALIENLQREHLNPVEIAISYKRLLEECSYTQEELARRIGKDRSTIANFLRLLRLPEEIQRSLRRGELSNGHARALVSLEDPALQLEIFRKVVKDDLSVRAVERWVRHRGRKRAQGSILAGSGAAARDSALTSLEDRLRQLFGTRVEVRPLRDGKGQIVLEYYSADDLDRLIEMVFAAGERIH